MGDIHSHDTLSDPSLVAFHEVVQTVARQTDLGASLALVAEKARALTGAASAAVTLLDPSRTLLDFAAVAGVNAAEILGQTVRVEDSLTGQTALTGELYLSHNSLEPDSTSGIGSPFAAGRSAAVVPIYVGGRPAGALAALNREEGRAFGGGEILRLQTLANTAALAIGMDGLRRQAAQKHRERDILYEAARAASSSLNVQEVLSSVLGTVETSIEMAAGAVFLLNDERNRLYVSADRGLEGEHRELQIAADSGRIAHALASGQPFILADTLQLADGDDAILPGLRSILAAPMVARSVAEGLVVVGSRIPDSYTQEDARLLSAVAGQAAVALENAWLYEDAMRRAQEATAIYELSQAIGSTLSLSRMLHFVADSVLSLLHVDQFALFLRNPRDGALEIKIARNLRRETVQTMKPRPGEGIAGWVFEFETPTAVQDVAADHRNRSCPIDGEGVNSLVSVPLQMGDEVGGVLQAMSSRRRLFTVGEMELLYTIANQVGAAIVNALMYEEARQRGGEIRKSVRRAVRAFGSTRDVPGAAQAACDLAREIIEADRSALLTLDGAGRLSVRALSGFRAAVGAAVEGETPSAWVARRGRSLLIEDFSQDARWPAPPHAAQNRVASYLGVPLKLGGEILGVLEVYTREPRKFTSDDARLLITFASQASVGLQNAVLLEQAGYRLADLNALHRLSALLKSQEADTARGEILGLLTEAVHADAGRLVWRGGQSEQAGQSDAFAAPAESAHRLSFPLTSGELLFLRFDTDRPFGTQERQLAETAANLLSSVA